MEEAAEEEMEVAMAVVVEDAGAVVDEFSV